MPYVTIEEAGSQLAQLIDRACNGEEIVIVHNSVPIAKIIPVTAEDLKHFSHSESDT